MLLQEHRIRSLLLPCNFQLRIETPNLDADIWMYLTSTLLVQTDMIKTHICCDMSLFLRSPQCLEIKAEVSTPTGRGARTTEKKTQQNDLSAMRQLERAAVHM